MKKSLLTLLICLNGLLLANAQQNLLFEQTLVHATDIEAYDEYLNSTYAKIAQ